MNFLLRLVVLVLAASACAPARADLRATYDDPNNQRHSLTIEIAGNGDLRLTEADGSYTLISGNSAYQVSAGPGGPRAISNEALAWLAAEDRRSGAVVRSSDNGTARPAKPTRLVAGATVNVAGFSGIEYKVPGAEGVPMVFGDQADLLPLGNAVLRYLQFTMQLSPEEESWMPENLDDLLAGKGVLEFWGYRLVSLDRSPIPVARFTLPVAPTTLADVKDLSEPDAPARPRSSIIAARFFEGHLLTLDDRGSMLAWTEGNSIPGPFTTPGEIAVFCTTVDEVWLASGAEGARLTVWGGKPGAWRKAIELNQSEREFFEALDCTGDEPLLLTSKTIHFLKSNRSVTAGEPTRRGSGFAVTLQHRGYLYVGTNAGEWGGGLRRYRLTGGSGELVDASDPQNLCGGTLNASCAPVTGLAPDPAHPECILATIGLVHFMSHGSVVRVCDGAITLAYAKPYTLETEWHFDPAKVEEESRTSVPFYALGSSDKGTWAVGSDGLYRFAGNTLPSFTAFPKITRWSASGIEWSDPDFVLIRTDMNQRHSMSGSSLILVPR
jgi:hypothetical protein